MALYRDANEVPLATLGEGGPVVLGDGQFSTRLQCGRAGAGRQDAG